jgi:TfoX/Sxy family transcriptional regulator of competence genes
VEDGGKPILQGGVFRPRERRWFFPPDLASESDAMAYRPSRYEQVMKLSEGLNPRARKIYDGRGMGVYTGEKMFAILLDDMVGLKLSPEDRAQALRLEGAGPFRPTPDGPELPDYVVMPRQVLDDEQAFKTWLMRSIKYARSKSRYTH